MTNETTFSQYLYMIGRFQDINSFYLGGLNVQSSNTATKVELGTCIDGVVARASQVLRPIDMGAWYTVRMEIEGQALTSYLDGEKCGAASVARGWKEYGSTDPAP
jgi:hypothetical protein